MKENDVLMMRLQDDRNLAIGIVFKSLKVVGGRGTINRNRVGGLNSGRRGTKDES